jgi:ribosome-associated translation inhibitor RaiA
MRQREIKAIGGTISMQIQINSDNHISMHPALSTSIEAELRRVLTKFEGCLTRIEVHLSDESGDKSDARDKRCLLAARPRRYQSLAVTNGSRDIQTAVSGAAGKMQRLLETTFGRLSDRRRRETPRTGLLDDLALAPE